MFLAQPTNGNNNGAKVDERLITEMKPFVNGFITVLASILVLYTVIAFGRVGYQYMTNPDDPQIRSLLVDTVRNVVIGWVIVLVATIAAQIITGVTF